MAKQLRLRARLDTELKLEHLRAHRILAQRFAGTAEPEVEAHQGSVDDLGRGIEPV
jgi:hypothetical protein